MSTSIFPEQQQSLAATTSHGWESRLWWPTPVEERAGLLFKREDLFAPLGYGGINGSKLRQALYLMTAQAAGKERIVSAASVKSPQLPMAAALALHFGMDTHLIIGATNPEAAIKRDMVQMGTWFGGKYEIIKVAYNTALQHRARQEATRSDFLLQYGITLDHKVASPADVANFHCVGANQVKNLPDVDTLIIPAGSCNSLTSILVGLLIYKPKVNRLLLIGVGPSKLQYALDRVAIIVTYLGLTGDLPPFEYVGLHELKWCTYQDERPFRWDGIELHPTYEGKVMTWLMANRTELINERNLFWIVGSKPRIEAMRSHCPELGPAPAAIRLVSRIPSLAA